MSNIVNLGRRIEFCPKGFLKFYGQYRALQLINIYLPIVEKKVHECETEPTVPPPPVLSSVVQDI